MGVEGRIRMGAEMGREGEKKSAQSLEPNTLSGAGNDSLVPLSRVTPLDSDLALVSRDPKQVWRIHRILYIILEIGGEWIKKPLTIFLLIWAYR